MFVRLVAARCNQEFGLFVVDARNALLRLPPMHVHCLEKNSPDDDERVFI
jgi:hypothetical protein